MSFNHAGVVGARLSAIITSVPRSEDSKSLAFIDLHNFQDELRHNLRFVQF